MPTLMWEDENFGSELIGRVIKWIVRNMKPEDVFDYDALEEWALDNGFEEHEVEYTIGRR